MTSAFEGNDWVTLPLMSVPFLFTQMGLPIAEDWVAAHFVHTCKGYLPESGSICSSDPQIIMTWVSVSDLVFVYSQVLGWLAFWVSSLGSRCSVAITRLWSPMDIQYESSQIGLLKQWWPIRGSEECHYVLDFDFDFECHMCKNPPCVPHCGCYTA